MTHAFFAREVLGELRPEELVGAVLPDALILSGLRWNESHRAGDRLYRSALEERERGGRPGNGFDPVRVARAAITHGADPRGLDFYGDEVYGDVVCGGSDAVPAEKGYAFQLAKPFAARAAAVCNLPRELGWWKGHNFIEMAVELVVASRAPGLGERLLSALETPALLEAVAGAVGRGLGLCPTTLGEGLRLLPRYLQLSPLSASLLAQKYGLQVRTRHGVKHVDVEGMEALIVDCLEVVRPSIDGFFRCTTGPVRATLKEYPS